MSVIAAESRLSWLLPRLRSGFGIRRAGLDAGHVAEQLRALGAWAPALHVLLFALGTVLFLPGSLFGLAGGALFGPALGAIVNLAGATLGAVAAFLIARYAAADLVRKRAGPKLERLIAGVEAEGWRFVALVRLVPLFPFSLIELCARFDPDTAWPVCARLTGLHDSRHACLFLARLCGPGSR